MANYFIVGGSSGIGFSLSNILAESGNSVYATFNKTNIESPNRRIIYNKLNVLDDSLNLDFLPNVVNGIVYCPGSINLKPFARYKAEDFLADYNLQLVGAVKVIQSVLPKMKDAENASIVLFSTVAVQTGLNFHSLVASSKGAVEGLTRALAAELSPKIRVNCIAPSLTDTPLAASLLNNEQKREANAQRHPLKKLGTPKDIAEMAAFLLSDKAGWITGQILHIDGGMGDVRI